MPPVRWKSAIVICVAAIFLFHQTTTASETQLQDAISMTSDGWRPIVGSRRPTYQEHELEITHYRNPSQKNSETVVKADPSTTTAPPSSKPKNNQQILLKKNHVKSQVVPNKMAGHYYGPSSHGPHIPLGGAVHSRPNHGPLMKKQPIYNKHQFIGGKRGKPIRGQAVAHSTRDEVFVQAPNSGSSYSFINQGPNSKRQTDGLGILGLGLNHFVNHQLDFANSFNAPHLFQQPFNTNPAFLFAKPPHTNDVHYQFKNQNDEYTRNLVPPPPYKLLETKKKTTTKDVTTTSVPPTFEQNFAFQTKTQKPKEQAVEVHVTKEKFKVFHNNVPVNYVAQVPEYVDYEYHTVRNPVEPSKLQTYEVTEGKQWQEKQPPPVFQYQQRYRQPTRYPQVELGRQPFLPTPYKPEVSVPPTSATQTTDISTVFSQVSSKMNKYRNEVLTNNPLFFDIKEVSTHYPILGRPELNPEYQLRPSAESNNEITTNTINKYNYITEEVEETTTTTPRMRNPQTRRRRPQTRPRTTTEEPVTTQSLTESYELQRTPEEEISEAPVTEAPKRRRVNGNRYRTTTPTPISEEVSSEKVVRGRYRYRQRNGNSPYRRLKPTDLPANHKMTQADVEEVVPSTTEAYEKRRRTTTIEPISSSEEIMSSSQSNEVMFTKSSNKFSYDDVGSTESSEEATDVNEIEKATELIQTPENELDFTTVTPSTEQYLKETIATTIPTTTTTEIVTSTVKSHRARRPTKYEPSNRPRFSVKDYRQRFSTTTETPSSTRSTENTRLRFPNRMRTRVPSIITTIANDEEVTEPIRNKFKPKESRYESVTEKSVVKSSRVRPFRGRTTEAPVGTTTGSSVKATAKPNLFSVRKRPPQLSLRSRLFNRNNRNNSEVATTVVPLDEEEEMEATTVVINKMVANEISTENNQVNDDQDEATESSTTSDILKNESVLYSQRVSDLTSSLKNQYDTPGLFKSVSPTSRRIPSYFTISTDDPILPIEAFFPNIKDKEKE